MFLFLSPGSREPVSFVLEVMLLEMANIDIHGGSFHFHVFFVTFYCYVILLFCSLVFQHFFFSFFFFMSFPHSDFTIMDCKQHDRTAGDIIVS